MTLYSKDELIAKFIELSEKGWVKNRRMGNSGGVGNTLEDYLGIEENNLPIPNAAEWELKAQRKNTTSLVTLFHSEPSPRALKFVPCVLLPHYGWQHKEAGRKYPETEMSFRQTITCKYSDRGFCVKVDRDAEKILIVFNPLEVDPKHSDWLNQVYQNIDSGCTNICTMQPYWGFRDLSCKAGGKLLNCFYVQADVKREEGEEYYWYNSVKILQNFSFKGFLDALESNNIYIDFDARSGHNHGTKFRMSESAWPLVYEKITPIIQDGEVLRTSY
ncbi:nciI [Candidatus Methanomassiliicoccus intestinalis]|uniref:MvaI/BcnI restriction endonuclease domain-containing protein n=3 Tax=Candidatus Methanomassiliicoccus intestinalis TaxID=1406512 RepID=R9T9H6_METII|nr:MvaI/BcnI restriction endonuclease family protein [Candidatus Methanomassiliicoccus intestinalis]AGN26306.1 hypothetical protein MMINT_09520 [Candidatus Methanomassiliicoccus intestinalis Issoire-Mx1]TQS84618.1 MAG: nciI [Candidatus Methanomassiliicoccus intestinalis]